MGSTLNDTLNDTSTTNIVGRPYNVILFNDSHHDMIEVAQQIIKAIHCTEQRAMNIMMEAHKSGRAIVFTGHLEKCELVESILNEIRLGTKIEPC